MANFYEAFAQGQANGLERQKAVNQRNMLAELQQLGPQVIGGDLAATDRAFALDPQRAQAYQAEGNRQQQQLFGLAKSLKQSAANPQMQAGIYRSAVPFLKRSFGAEIPDEFDAASVMPIVDQVLAVAANAPSMGAGMGGGVQSTYVDDQGQRVAILRDGSTRILGGNDAGSNQQTLTIDVNGTPTQVTFDRRTGRYTNASLGMPQQSGALTGPQAPGTPMLPQGGGKQVIEQDAALANQMIAAGIPAEQVDAFIAQRASQASGTPRSWDQGQLAQGAPLVGRRKEDEAAAVEAARQAVQLGGLPYELGLRTNAAINQAAGIDRAKNQQEKASGRIAAETSLRDAESNLDRLSNQAKALMANPGLSRVTGAIGAVPDFPGSQAANARAEVETLKSQVGFGVLQAMREASKTGGALGAVSDTENRLLQSNLAALDSSQSPEAFKANLQKIVDYVDGAKGRMRQAFHAQYQGQGAQQQSAGQQRTIVRRGTSNGRQVVQYSDGTIEYGN